ncbi:hypothetical protein D9758_009074 [Tetrapyrgos nigripes]|uniref:Reverse transcriptase domain-containing protein n=1 Tax=Tetrapyrgos nigripes TaxID=182062 RepID=A0A8H5GA16_9AGAR|nr:hypothetical protein D9758_009074 [Tetrapyrgos nigripes]
METFVNYLDSTFTSMSQSGHDVVTETGDDHGNKPSQGREGSVDNGSEIPTDEEQEQLRLITEACDSLITRSYLEESLSITGADNDAINEYLQEVDTQFPAGRDGLRKYVRGETDERGDEGDRGDENGLDGQAANALEKGEAYLRTRREKEREGGTRNDASITAEQFISDALGGTRGQAPSVPGGSSNRGTGSEGLSASLLATAPHLGNLLSLSNDRHLRETQNIRIAVSKESSLKTLVQILEFIPLKEPISRGTWEKIIKDEYVDFEKLHASSDPTYDRSDESKEIIPGFFISRKDTATKKKIKTEAEWYRVYEQWSAGVEAVYKHRVDELRDYRSLISEMFKDYPDHIDIVIAVDTHARFQYSKKPYRLDNNQRLECFLHSKLNQAKSSSAHSSLAASSSKHTGSSDSNPRPAKQRQYEICLNWNRGACEQTPCGVGHRHVFVEEDTEQRISQNVSLNTTPEDNELSLIDKQVQLVLEGPRRVSDNAAGGVKCKAPQPSYPRFRRNFIWHDAENEIVSPSVIFSETATPLPSVPDKLLHNPEVLAALSSQKDFIQVTTPYNVDRLRNLLSLHPNQPFIESVLKGLEVGFWPCHSGEWEEGFNALVDNYPMEDPDLNVVRAYRDKEVAEGRWSPCIHSFVKGMKSLPMFVVWQGENRVKGRVITDFTGSGINTGIPHEEAHVKYNDMHSFGLALRQARIAHPNNDLVLFKDDIKGAFPTLPAHPIWQLRQVVTVDNDLHIVRRMVFGGRSTPRIWCALSSLICWIAVRRFRIRSLHIYMDDFFRWDLANDKQDHGPMLKIIRLWVDINKGVLTLSPSSIKDLIARVSEFLSIEDRKHPLRSWWCLSGHLNWSLNILPWARPALSALYKKMRGKSIPQASIPINAAVRESLEWYLSILPSAIGVKFFDKGIWGDEEADMVFWTDSSLTIALSFVFAGNGFVYDIKPPPPSVKVDIFFLELVAILSAINFAVSRPSPPKRVLIWSDSLNSVAAFDSLGTSEHIHTCVMLAVTGLVIRSGIDVKRTSVLTSFPVYYLRTSVVNFPHTKSTSSSLPATFYPNDGESHFDVLGWFSKTTTHTIEESTLAGYKTGARDYVTFCINHNLSLEPTISTLCRYIAYTSQFIASGPNYLTGAHHFLREIYPEFATNHTSHTVQATIIGLRKFCADAVHRKLPLKTSHLDTFYNLYLKNPTYDNLLFITILSCMFYRVHRASELIAKRQCNIQKTVKHSSLKFDGNRVSYKLPYHKGDWFYRGSEILLGKHVSANPVFLLHTYPKLRDSLHKHKFPLFLKEDGSLPTRSWFEGIFFKLVNREYGGHSVRAGGATYYASLGLSESIIQALERWSSDAWRIYIWDHATVQAEIQLSTLHQFKNI